MLTYSDNKRVTASQALQHPYFNGISASLKSMANSHAGVAGRRARNVRQMNMFGSTESLHDKGSDFNRGS